jgi:peroxiredoxin
MKRLTPLGLSLSAVLVAVAAPCAAKGVNDFTLPSATDGSIVRLSDYAGKVVLINWWRTDCGWSQRESPKLTKLYDKYRSKGLVILGISDDTGDTVSGVPAYLKRYGITWAVGLNDQGEFIREIRPLGTGATPENYLVSRTGQVAYLGLDRGDEAWQKLESAVVLALADPVPATPLVKPRELAAAPPLSLPDLQKKPVKLASFAGRPLIVNFFNSNSCDWTGALLSRLHQEYSARGLQVVGVNLFNEDAEIQSCVNKHGAKYLVLRGDQATQQAWIGKSEGWATFFVTSDGKMFKSITNSVENGLEAAVFPKYAQYLVTKK